MGNRMSGELKEEEEKGLNPLQYVEREGGPGMVKDMEKIFKAAGMSKSGTYDPHKWEDLVRQHHRQLKKEMGPVFRSEGFPPEGTLDPIRWETFIKEQETWLKGKKECWEKAERWRKYGQKNHEEEAAARSVCFYDDTPPVGDSKQPPPHVNPTFTTPERTMGLQQKTYLIGPQIEGLYPALPSTPLEYRSAPILHGNFGQNVPLRYTIQPQERKVDRKCSYCKEYVPEGLGKWDEWSYGDPEAGPKYVSGKGTPKVGPCFFCKKIGHIKKDCRRYQGWLKRKEQERKKKED